MNHPRLVRCAVCVLLALLTDKAVGATRGIWISREEIRSLPMSGAAWENVRAAAYGSWGTPKLGLQTVQHGVYVLAGALVYVRSGDTSLRSKVRDGIMGAKRTLDEPAELLLDTGDPNTNPRTLALGRQLGAYVIAADLIDLGSFDPPADLEFRLWLAAIRTTTLPLSNPRWPTLVLTHERTASNWGCFAGASRIAASLYLGDMADVARADSIFRAWAGERSYYPNVSGSVNGYFEPTSDFNSSWCCNPSAWVNGNPPCILSGINVDGAEIEDVSRGGGLQWPPGPSGLSYTWEGLQGVFVQAEMLQRAGYPAYERSSKVLRRAMDFMGRAGWAWETVSRYVPWIANRRYGTSYPTMTPIPMGRIMGWTDWTHASAAPPADSIRPAPITDFAGN